MRLVAEQPKERSAELEAKAIAKIDIEHLVGAHR